MRFYKVEVWYRFAGGEEKDYQIITVEAKNEEQAKNRAMEIIGKTAISATIIK